MSPVAFPAGPQIGSIFRILEQVIENRDMCLVLSNASWELYEELDRRADDMPVRPRLTFCDNELEIMSPLSYKHDHNKTALGHLIEDYCVDREIEFDGAGSTTQKIKSLRGREPDESYFIGRAGSQDDYPDLVIEIKVTSGGIERLKVWHPFEVREVWIVENRKIRLFEHRAAGYEEISESKLIPGIPIADLEELALVSPTSKAIGEFRKRIAR